MRSIRKPKCRPFGTFDDDDNSDSDDSDYCPGDKSPIEDVDLKRQKKRAKIQVSKASPSKKSTRRDGGPGASKQLISNGSHILKQFPPEILVKVFQYGVACEGVVRFIPRVSGVCRAWNQVAKNGSVWSYLDIPYSRLKLKPPKIQSLLTYDLSCCKYLNLTAQTEIKEPHILSLLERMPGLRGLTLSDCDQVKGSLLKLLPTRCPQLARFVLNFTKKFSSQASLNVTNLETFLSHSGHHLVELQLSRILCIQSSPRQIFSAIAENCPNLEHLCLSIPDPDKTTAYPSRRFEFDAEAFFAKCPRISTLELDGFNLVEPRGLGRDKNLLKLEHLHSYSQTFHIHDQNETPVFYRLFGSTPHLQFLNISCSRLFPSLIRSSVRSVTQLIMMNMRWRDSEVAQIYEALDAWKHSLVHLDLSFNMLVDSAVDHGLMVYQVKDDFPLKTLTLKQTNVTAALIQFVLDNCRHLEAVDLNGCRELPRGCKREFTKDEFKFLKKCLKRS